MNVSTERNRMEHVRGRSLVEAARLELDVSERLQCPGYVSALLRRNTLLGKISETVVRGTFSARSMLLEPFGSRDT
jgi:hypothetical protein